MICAVRTQKRYLAKITRRKTIVLITGTASCPLCRTGVLVRRHVFQLTSLDNANLFFLVYRVLALYFVLLALLNIAAFGGAAFGLFCIVRLALGGTA